MKGHRRTDSMEAALMPIGPAVNGCFDRFARYQKWALEIRLCVLRSEP